MEAILYLTEAGFVLLDNNLNVISKFKHDVDDFVDLMNMREVSSLNKILKIVKEKEIERIKVQRPLDYFLEKKGWKKFEILSKEELEKIFGNKLSIMVKSGLCISEDEAKEKIRIASMKIAEEKVREVSGRIDLQVIQSVEALDELDKVINLISTRVREWHGLHFPELAGIVDNNKIYCEIVSKSPLRDDIDEEFLQNIGVSKSKIRQILDVKDVSKGGELSISNLSLLSNLASQTLKLMSLRDRLAKHIDDLMNKVAPNISSIAGPTVGARLISKAGGLDKLAVMPASTIQVLGAEKALFRSLKTGSRPPKHGIIFQHQSIHSAPRWQRGKIARSLASKIAIAARIDMYRGEKEEGIEEKLEERIKSIRKKQPKKKMKKKRRRK